MSHVPHLICPFGPLKREEPLTRCGSRFPVSIIDPWSGRFAPQLGAVLATPGPVAHASIKTPRRLQDWIRLNQRVFPRYYWEARRNDLWIITSTYSTADMWLKVWEDTAAAVRVRFSGGAARHEVSAGDGVFCRDESWLHYSAEVRLFLLRFVSRPELLTLAAV